MATQPDDDTATLDPTEGETADELDPGEGASDDGDEGEGSAEGEQAGAEGAEGEGDEGAEADGELVVSIGDETPEPGEEDEPAKPWVNELRRNYRQTQKRLREIEAENARLKGAGGAPSAPVAVGEEPTLPEFADAEAIATFKKDWAAWNQRKAEAERQAAERQAAEKRAEEEWSKKRQSYESAKAALVAKMPTYEEAEDAVREALSVAQQGMLLKGCAKPELFVAAIGKSPKRLKELAAITDPVEFCFACGRLEKEVKVQPRKAAPAPERRVTGNVAGAAAVDNHLAKLEAEADRTGDRTKVAAYRRQLSLKQKQAA